MTCSDDVNGSYTSDAFLNNGAGVNGSGSVGIFSVQNTTTSSKVVTLTLGASTTGFLKIFELTNAEVSAAKDTSNTTGVNTGLGGAFSLSLTTGTNNCAIFSITTHYPAGTAVDSGYTSAFTETGLLSAYHFGEFNLDVGTAGTKTLTYNGYSSTDCHTGAAVAYKANPNPFVARSPRGFDNKASLAIMASQRDDGKWDHAKSVDFWWGT